MAAVGRLPLIIFHHILKNSDREAQEFVYRGHPLGIPLCQIIIHRDKMDFFTGNGVQKHRKGCRQGFTFPCLHLGDDPAVQDNASKYLNIKVPHLQGSTAYFSDQSEGLGKNFFHRGVYIFILTKPFLQFIGKYLQLRIGH